jgi:hypothetical protein
MAVFLLRLRPPLRVSRLRTPPFLLPAFPTRGGVVSFPAATTATAAILEDPLGLALPRAGFGLGSRDGLHDASCKKL